MMRERGYCAKPGVANPCVKIMRLILFHNLSRVIPCIVILEYAHVINEEENPVMK